MKFVLLGIIVFLIALMFVPGLMIPFLIVDVVFVAEGRAVHVALLLCLIVYAGTMLI